MAGLRPARGDGNVPCRSKTTLWLSVLLTLTHGALYLGLEYLPPKL